MLGFYKERQGRWISGVFAGIAKRFVWDPKWLRALFLAILIFVDHKFLLVLAYVALAYFLPYRHHGSKNSKRNVGCL
ncbi:PspC domain-containing protein [Streptococcus sp. X13SY08]|uniref:PspC domain-containing protein n=1 Tax=Streptococcus sp. X13SY08 TaxID=1676616 RepID=UPI00066FD620|nr:PspC domain-containing protein [Streptococcus sp. X13SY08]